MQCSLQIATEKPRAALHQKHTLGLATILATDTKIVPSSGNLHAEKPTDKKSDNFRYKTKTKTEDGRSVWILPHPVNVPALGSSKKTGSVEPFWCIARSTEEVKEGDEPIGNMKIQHVTVLGTLAMRMQLVTSCGLRLHGSICTSHRMDGCRIIDAATDWGSSYGCYFKFLYDRAWLELLDIAIRQEYKM